MESNKPKITLNTKAVEFVPKARTQAGAGVPNQYANPYGMGYNPNLMMNPTGQQANVASFNSPGYNPLIQGANPYAQTPVYGMNTNVKAATVTTTKPKTENKPKEQKPKVDPKAKKTKANEKDKEKEKTEADLSSNKTIQDLSKEISKAIIKNSAELEKPVELLEDSKEGKMVAYDEKSEHCNIVFIGHVDHGKSTICGSILFKTGMVDKRTIEKYAKEAKANNRESWTMAYIMDTSENEKAKGKTVEVGKAFFKTATRRFTILDAPGHELYVPSMLEGAFQADIGCLIVSAKMGEFESGFEREGKTREHALLAKALGINSLIVIINKMDDDTVKWSKDRYDQIKKDLIPFLKSLEYDVENEVVFLPLSGLLGENLDEPVSSHKCPWYEGPYLLQALNEVKLPERNIGKPFRMPILEKYKENSVYIMGKIEQGILRVGLTYVLMPSCQLVECAWLFNNEEEGIPYAWPGESIRLKVKGIDNEAHIVKGSILSSIEDIIPSFQTFSAELSILELLEYKPVVHNDYECILHLHTVAQECKLHKIEEYDEETKEYKSVKIAKSFSKLRCLVTTSTVISGEKFEVCPNLGRLTLRDGNKTIGVGKILKVKPVKK